MTSSNPRPRPVQRATLRPVQPIEPIEVICNKYSNQILDLIPQPLLDKAREITLADMLESEITACETISWLLNIVKFTRYYELNNTPDNIEFYQELLDIKNLLSNQCIQDCFKLSDSLRLEYKSTRNQSYRPNVFLEPALRIERKQVLPQKPVAEELTLQKTKEVIMAFIKKCRENKRVDFTFVEICEVIEKYHLEGDKLRWSLKDQAAVGNDNIQWKATISNALQFFQTKEDLTFIARKNIWYVLPSYP